MRSKLITVISITLVLLFLIVAHYRGWTRIIENKMYAVLVPASQKMYTLTQGKLTSSTSDPQTLCTSSTEDVTTLQVETMLLSEENANLREQLHFFASSTWPTVGADVIARDIDPIGTTVVINAGAQAGIRLGNPVVVGSGRLIGSVVRIEDTTAVVRLLNDPQSHIAATVLNRDHSLGLVEGGYGISVRLNFIPQSEVVKPGDQIVTSGLEPTIPRGLLIGMAQIVEKKPQEPFQQAVLETAADLHHVNVVSVILYSHPQ